MPLNGNFQGTLERVKAAVEKALEDTAVEVQADARAMAPYDTGALRDSILPEKVADLEYRVTANVDYSLYVHEGHSTKSGTFVQGIPFLVQPLNEKIPFILEKIKSNL
ncbi:HK97 gp10 family phage protein (plasmid) [Deinococcus radiomollis]|uniref:HK97 gp10 family phage protein n=1 Tax=Deinococcus radiomollis TaxID=468916 RepID=UPI003892B673